MDSLVIGALVNLSIATCKLLRTPDASDKHVVINNLLLLLIALIFLRTTIWTILTASLFYRFGLDSPNIMLKIRDILKDILMEISEKLKTCVPKAWIPQQNKSMDSPDRPINPIQRPVQVPTPSDPTAGPSMKISEKLKTCVPKAWIPQQNKSMDLPDWPMSPIPRFQPNPIPIPSKKITVGADYLNISCPNDLNKDTCQEWSSMSAGDVSSALPFTLDYTLHEWMENNKKMQARELLELEARVEALRQPTEKNNRRKSQ